jgi:hypothetical protein
MSSNIIALPHDATKANQSTNIINHDKNTTLSDRTLTNVNDGQKKRVRRKTHKHRRLEMARDTKEPPFDAKDILPESKALKSISKLLESMKKVVRFPDSRSTFTDPYKQSESTQSRSLTFECIDGSSRTYPPAQDAEPTTKIAPANSLSLQPAIQIKSPQPQPATTRKTAPRRQREGPSANFEKNRAFTIGLAGILQQGPSRPVENKSHTPEVLPMKEQKRPRPKINERCRRWLRNECDLGYQCNFVHEDLEYDVPLVSFDLSLCKHSNHVNILTGAQGIP